MHLYAGSMLFVDLDAGQVEVKPLREEWLPEYWGAWGLATRYFIDEYKTGAEPLNPATPIVIMTGPFCGTNVPLTSRFCLVSRSPYNGAIFESNAGGSFGPELKYAGFDGLVIKGAASKPVWLKIENGSASLEDASAMWGHGIFKTEDMVKQAMGTDLAKVMAIGQAGENGVGFACIGSEAYRQLGRGGCGALFGSKKLKAIGCRGVGGVSVADLPRFIERVDFHKQSSLLTEDNLWASTDGTPILVDVTNEMGLHPTKNFTHGVNEGKDGINSEAVKAHKTGDRACFSCPMACGKFTRCEDSAVEGPEYETLCLGGSNCGINDLPAIIRFNRLCDDLGLDTISAGSILGTAMDMAEQGAHDFGLRFGEEAEYLAATREMALLSTDRGRELAQGAKRLTEKYGVPHLAIVSKGMEFPAYDPRGNYGVGLAYATSERGACHLRAFPLFTETPFDLAEMTQAVVDSHILNSVKWSLCICDFWGTVNTSIMAELLSLGLGREVTAEELDTAGARIWSLIRLFNAREGFSSKDDSLPDRITKQGLKGGPLDGRVFSTEDLERMKRDYYAALGWDEQGRPTEAKLAELGLAGL